MSHDKFEWSKPLTTMLITTLEGFPCLYDCKHKFYSNHHARVQALIEIRRRLMEAHPSITIESDDIKRKITNLRSQLTAEIRKNKKSQKSGVGTEEIYEPTIWWFSHIQYLIPYLRTRSSESNLSQKENVEAEDSEEIVITSETEDISSQMSSTSSKSNINENLLKPESSKTKKRTHSEAAEDIVIQETVKSLQILNNNLTNNKTSNPLEAYCKSLCMELSSIDEDELLTDVKHEINNIVYKYKKQFILRKKNQLHL
ncbi:hypothetical protein FQR65_LT18734 [Abscondita terminalis]|nr:hypothetical protein FQR65_LT18734 [Abscondita terminalis]